MWYLYEASELYLAARHFVATGRSINDMAAGLAMHFPPPPDKLDAWLDAARGCALVLYQAEERAKLRTRYLMAGDLGVSIRIKVEAGKQELLYAISPDMPSLLVAERTLDLLRLRVPIAIRELYAADGGIFTGEVIWPDEDLEQEAAA